MSTIEYLKNIVIGAFTGFFMMMPGASGATMAVVFGIYERLIRDISKLSKYLVEDIRFLLTLGIGAIIGVLACAKGLDFLIDDYEIPLMFMFAMLILVQIPDIWKQTNDGEKLTSSNIIAMAAGFAIMILVLIIGQLGMEQSDSAGVLVMLFAGMIYAVCAISPGISGSTILLALGLFTPVIDSLGNLELKTILPLAVGAVISVILFAKFINHCVNSYRKSTYCVILGLTAGSIVTVIGNALLSMDGEDDILVQCVVFAIIGLIIGWGIHLFSKHVQNSSGSE